MMVTLMMIMIALILMVMTMVMIMMKITLMTTIVPRECRNDAGHSVHNLHHDDYIDDDHDCTGDVDDNGDNHDEDYTDDDDLTT